ncbi:MAG: preprotein translocase subunit SecE [Bacteroides sp.]|nr:preprotein translocase subunit SecE [Bacillota bacterium]MCM1393548.1 preprotein translocase subunit SecE [[Eubacterium] siraeum]MCM1455352.1 preprotein translocase subunit SecE [Bacteroides sp.]
MANKKPKNAIPYVDTMKQQERAAVNVDTATKPKKAKKTVKKNADKPNPFKRMAKGIKGIFSELKKVSWLSGKDVVKNTLVVLVVVVLFFVALFIIDYVFQGLLGLITNGHWKTIFI